MDWKEKFKQGKEIILSTCSKDNSPNSNIVISLGFIDNKLLIADCQMNTTIRNLKENPKICVIGGYFRLKGIVEIFSSGKYFDICKEKNKDYKLKNAILVNIKEVFDLEDCKVIKP